MQLYLGDCLDVLPTLPDKSVDMIMCDLPYGTTEQMGQRDRLAHVVGAVPPYL